MAVFAIIEPRFLSPLNLFNVMRQVSIYGLLAIGMTFVILTAGIDLSVGSLLALCRAGRRGGVEGRPLEPLHGRRGAGAVGYRLVARRARRDRRRAGRRLPPGLRDHPAEGAALRGDARRHVGVPRRRAALRRRRPDQRLRARLRLVGAGRLGHLAGRCRSR